MPGEVSKGSGSSRHNLRLSSGKFLTSVTRGDKASIAASFEISGVESDIAKKFKTNHFRASTVCDGASFASGRGGGDGDGDDVLVGVLASAVKPIGILIRFGSRRPDIIDK
jgi:hypothetical protein